MKDIKNKLNNVTTEEGFLTAEDTNSIINELKNAVNTFMDLNSNDLGQLSKAMDAASKSMTYTDTGSTNHVKLVRPGVSDNVEMLKDGMTVIFKPAHSNNGDFKVKVNNLPEKNAENGSGATHANFLRTHELYAAIYNAHDDKFLVYQISFNSADFALGTDTSAIAKNLTDAKKALTDKINADVKKLRDETNDAVDKLNKRVDDVTFNVDFGEL